MLRWSGGKCCYSQFGDDSTCGSYPGGSDGLCNSDYSKSCNGDSDCEASQQNNLIVKVSLPSDAPANESYSLGAVAGSVSISASGPLGARHALSTLSQLIASTKNGFVMSNEVHIADAPSKSYRGIMVDTSRHVAALGSCNMALVIPYQASHMNPYDMRIKCEKGSLCYDFDPKCSHAAYAFV